MEYPTTIAPALSLKRIIWTIISTANLNSGVMCKHYIKPTHEIVCSNEQLTEFIYILILTNKADML